MGKARDLSRAHRLCTTCQVPSPVPLTCSAAVARAPSCPAKNSGPVLPQGLCMGCPLAWSAVWLPLPPPPGLCSMHMTQRRPPDLPFYKDGPSLHCLAAFPPLCSSAPRQHLWFCFPAHLLHWHSTRPGILPVLILQSYSWHPELALATFPIKGQRANIFVFVRHTVSAMLLSSAGHGMKTAAGNPQTNGHDCAPIKVDVEKQTGGLDLTCGYSLPRPGVRRTWHLVGTQ